MSIVNRLFEIRTQREMTQQDVAELTGVSRVTVGRLDRDRKYRPKGKTMQDLARGLGLRIGDLFDDDELGIAPGVPVVGFPAGRATASSDAAGPNDLVTPGITHVQIGTGNGTATPKS